MTWTQAPILELCLKLGNTHSGHIRPQFTLRTESTAPGLGLCQVPPVRSLRMLWFDTQRCVPKETLPGDILVLGIIVMSSQRSSADRPSGCVEPSTVPPCGWMSLGPRPSVRTLRQPHRADGTRPTVTAAPSPAGAPARRSPPRLRVQLQTLSEVTNGRRLVKAPR